MVSLAPCGTNAFSMDPSANRIHNIIPAKEEDAEPDCKHEAAPTRVTHKEG